MGASVENIVDSYRSQTLEETVEDEIRSLDKAAKGNAMKAALVPGIIGVILLGIGMSLTLEASGFFALGVVLGIAGIALCAVAYPIYSKRLAAERESVRGKILELASRIAE